MNINYTNIMPSEFTNALHILDLFETNSSENNPLNHEIVNPKTIQELNFPNHSNGSKIQAALNILHKAAQEGSAEQKTTLTNTLHSSKIKSLNKLLLNHTAFTEKVKQLGFTDKDANCVKGYQIALPQTKYERFLDAVTLIPRVVMVIFATLVTLSFAGLLALPIDQCFDLNPKKSVEVPAADIKTSNENLAPYSGFEIAGVVCFNSPLRGAPALDKLFNAEKMDQRYKEMTPNNNWRHQLYTDSLRAEQNGELTVYTYGSTLDPAAYNDSHKLTDNPTRSMTVGTEGHHDTMISPRAMGFLNKALQEIDPTGTVPVIQLHGSGAGKYQFTIFRLIAGSQRTFAADYAESRFGNDPKTSIVHYAQNEHIQTIFKKVFEVTGQKKAILVGHSMGGFVSLEIARNIRNFKASQMGNSG